jgi:hypothetical protein
MNNKQVNALGKTKNLSKEEKYFLFDNDKIFFQTKKAPQKGDWLYENKELGQTFKKFSKNLKKINKNKNKIYIFNINCNNNKIKLIKEYITSFFLGIEVVVLKDDLDLNKIRNRKNENDKIQLNSSDLISVLLKKAPKDYYWY